jgi:hypothetical protein
VDHRHSQRDRCRVSYADSFVALPAHPLFGVDDGWGAGRGRTILGGQVPMPVHRHHRRYLLEHPFRGGRSRGRVRRARAPLVVPEIVVLDVEEHTFAGPGQSVTQLRRPADIQRAPYAANPVAWSGFCDHKVDREAGDDRAVGQSRQPCLGRCHGDGAGADRPCGVASQVLGPRGLWAEHTTPRSLELPTTDMQAMKPREHVGHS